MRAPGNGAGFDAGGMSHFDIGGGVADVKGGSGVAVKRGEGEPDAFGMRFVVLHRVRADEYVDVCADAELFAVGAQDGGFFLLLTMPVCRCCALRAASRAAMPG